MSVQIFYTDDDGEYDFSSQVSIGSNYSIGGELNQSRLWGEQDIPAGDSMSQIWRGYAISAGVSDSNGNLVQGISVSHAYGNPVDASRGVTIIFDAVNGIFPKSIDVAIYSDRDLSPQGLIVKHTYSPTSPVLYCPELVTNTPVLAIYIESKTTNMPHVRLRIGAVYYGKITVWDDSNITACKIVESYDPLSMSIMQNVCDFNVLLDQKIEYKKDKRMRAEVYHNGNLQGVFFVQTLKNLGRNQYNITCSDISSVLDKIQYPGDIVTAKPAGEIIREIMTAAQIQYTIDSGLSKVPVTGLISPSTCREALRQVLFAIGGTFTTSRTAKAEISPINLSPEPVQAGSVFMGDTVDDNKAPTAVEIKAYEYTKDEKSTEVNISSTNYGKDRKGIFVPFDAPSYRLTNLAYPVELEKITPFYAIVDGTKLHLYQDSQGQQYYSTDWYFAIKRYAVSEYIYTAAGSTFGDTKAISGYTLVSKDIGQTVADRCLSWLSKEKKLRAKIAGDFKAGDCISAMTTEGIIKGVITEARYSLQTAKKVEEVTLTCL